jgi:uncharacterized protein (UPF0297 family)
MFSMRTETERQAYMMLKNVYNALNEKGYNPVSQIVGYLLSEDPTYITNHKNARADIRKIDRDELLRIVVQHYLSTAGN